MSDPWEFTTDAESDAFCREIVGELARLFDVTAEEAIGRVNRQWRGLVITGQSIVHHELPEYWAHVVYLGKSSCWWITGEARDRLGLGPVVPIPYP